MGVLDGYEEFPSFMGPDGFEEFTINVKKTATETLIHIAGAYAMDTGQSCIICGFVLVGAVGWEAKMPTVWEESGLILVDDPLRVDLSSMGESEFPEARRCKNFDDDDEEDDIAWQ